jgi:hypothetical protein
MDEEKAKKEGIASKLGFGERGTGERREAPPEERILAEQELSAERMREGKAWHHLAPGQSSGTQAPPKPSAEASEPSKEGEHRRTPGAARAEMQGERPNRRKVEEQR